MSSPTCTFRNGRKNESRWPAIATLPDSPGSDVLSMCPRPTRSVRSSEPSMTTADTPRRGIDNSASGVPGFTITDDRGADNSDDRGLDADGVDIVIDGIDAS